VRTHGNRVSVRYSFASAALRGPTGPRAVQIVIRSADPRFAPSGGYYLVQRRSDTVEVPLPLFGSGPYAADASAFARSGLRSEIASVAIP
jgi:hypothetical protein